MKNSYLRRYLLIHTWTGVAAALILFIAFYAGSFTMYAPEISQWARPYDGRVQPVADADALWSAFLQQTPAAKSAELVLDAGAWPAPAVRTPEQYLVLNQAGALINLPLAGETVGEALDQIHRRGGLPLPTLWAERVVGIVALIYVLAMVSGVIIILATLLRELFVLRLGRSSKLRWRDGHNLLGISSLPFHFIIAFTTVVFCLHDWVFDAQDAWVYPQGLDKVAVLPGPPPGQPTDPHAWQSPSALLAGLQQSLPNFAPVALAYRGIGSGDAVVMVAGANDQHFKRSPRVGYALLDPANGELLERTYVPGQDESAWASWLIPLFALHFGSFGGELVLFIYFLLGVAGALLFYTGNALWVVSRTRRARADGSQVQARHVRYLAAFNEGISLGTVAGLPAGLLASRWLTWVDAAPASIAVIAFYLCVLIFVLLAFWRGGDSGRPLMLGLAAAATLAVPLVSAWSWMGGNYYQAFWPMDVLLLSGALVLGVLAWRQRGGRKLFSQ